MIGLGMMRRQGRPLGAALCEGGEAWRLFAGAGMTRFVVHACIAGRHMSGAGSRCWQRGILYVPRNTLLPGGGGRMRGQVTCAALMKQRGVSAIFARNCLHVTDRHNMTHAG